MKILYGVQGTGNGHISRARIMAKRMNELGIDVDFLFSGREREKFFDMECFGDFKVCQGMSFITKEGNVRLLETLKKVQLGQFLSDVKSLDLSQYDVILNDFEPISAWAAKRQNKPCIAISHQASFLYPVPKKGANWTDKQILKYFAPASINLGVHWYHFGSNIMPPFIESAHKSSVQENKILVYLPFESIEQIKPLLSDFADYEFYCYHPEAKDEEHGHIHMRELSRDGFKRDLSNCSGIIANAGFELSSEALCYGKRILLKPLNGQFEQSSNAHTLEVLGLATVMKSLDFEIVEQWLGGTESGAVHFPDDPKPLIDWICRGDYSDTQSLVNELWQLVQFPDAVKNRLASA